MDGIIKAGGAAGQTLFHHQILVSQLSLQAAGPALVFVEANTAVGAIGGVGAIAVGVGITETNNMLFHSVHLLIIINRIPFFGVSSRGFPYFRHYAIKRIAVFVRYEIYFQFRNVSEKNFQKFVDKGGFIL